MRKMITSNLAIGFLFGLVFSLIAYFMLLDIAAWQLLLLPFAISVLCVAGGLVAVFVISWLDKHSALSDRMKYAIGFFAAAVFNVTIVVSLLYRLGHFSFDRQVWFGGTIGLTMGAIYAAYRFTLDQVKERVEFLAELAEKNRKLQEASRYLAIIDERNRMSRELHDSISQGLHGLTFALHSLRREWEQPTARGREILDHMEATAGATLLELRSMIDELKPSLLADQGLEAAMRMIGDLFSQRCAVPVEFLFRLTGRMVPEAEAAVFRIVQEGLANIERHAAASHVALKLDERDDRVILTLSDDGKGFDVGERGAGNGLNNMRQRAEDVGGSFRISSKVGVGTTLTVMFPKPQQ